MKFMLMMNHKGQGPYQLTSWSKDDLAANIGFMKGFAKKLAAKGELISAQGLSSPDQAKLVRAKPDGTPDTDGVFPEAKEFVVGFWLVDVDSAARAYEVAAEASLAPGPGGQPLYLNIEVRQVMSAPT